MGACASAQRKRSSGNSSRKVRASLVHSDPIVPVEKPENVVAAVSADPPVSTSSHGFTSRVSPFNAVASFSNHGSKEETFFDSQLWLESDCDDEFYSVNGDFTPSRGSTPLYRSIPGTPVSRNLSSRVNRALFEGTSSPYYTTNTYTEEPNRPIPSRASSPLNRSASAAAPRVDSDPVATRKSPPAEKKRRKKLGELFRESFRGKRQDEECRHQTEEAEAEASPLALESDINNADAFISGMKLQPKTTKEDKPADQSLQWCFPRLHSARGFKKMTPLAAPAIAVDA